MEQNEAIKDTIQQRCWKGDNLLIYECNISHSSWFWGESWPLYLGVRLISRSQRDFAEYSKDIFSFDQLAAAT